MTGPVGWAISGTYLEACNCEAICPCRRVGGRAGGRSTYGECIGALSWAVASGGVGDVDLAGLGAVMATRYDDDEPGSPWTFALFVDERGDERQRQALADDPDRAPGGTPMRAVPVGLQGEPIRSAGRRRRSRSTTRPAAAGSASASGSCCACAGRVERQEPVTCIIPGHDRDGRELYADLLRVDEGPLAAGPGRQVRLRGDVRATRPTPRPAP